MKDDGFYYWLAGLIDGEGCFTMGKGNLRSPYGATYTPIFSLCLRDDDEHILRLVHFRTGLGKFYHDRPRRDKRNNNPRFVWKVSNIQDCMSLIELLDRYPLRSKKQLPYQVWREVVLDKAAHLGSFNGGSAKESGKQNKDMHETAYAALKELHAYHPSVAMIGTS